MKLKQVEPTIVTIGDMDFYIRPFPAFKAANMTGELASLLAPLLGALAPMVSEADKSRDTQEESKGMDGLLDMDAGKVVETMMNCTSIDGNQMEKMMKKLLLGGHIAVELEEEDGSREAMALTQDLADEIFCGDVQDMFVLCYHVIRLNYKRFFGKLASLSGKAKSKEKKSPRKIL